MDVWHRNHESFVEEVVRYAARIAATAATLQAQRLPIAWLIDLFMAELLDELERRGVPQRVAADMIGVSRRTLMRHHSDARERVTDRRRTQWSMVYARVVGSAVSREELGLRLPYIDPLVLASLVADMVASGWLIEKDKLLQVPERGSTERTELEDDVLSSLVQLLRTIDPSLSADELADRANLDRARVRATWGADTAPHGTVIRGKAADFLLRDIARHAMQSLIYALERGSTEVVVARYWVALRDKPGAQKLLSGAFNRANKILSDAARDVSDPTAAFEDGNSWVAVLLQSGPRPLVEPED